MRRRARFALAALASGLVLSSCASLNVDAMPIPGSGGGAGYDIIAEFASVLNLPERAKVVMDGTKVGVVTGMTLDSSKVDVTLRIDRDVVVPSDVHSVLQQATVLGDTYVSLERAPDADSATPRLEPGGRIPITHTTSPPQIEDTLANLATFVGSGMVQRAQNTVININRVTPPRAEIREMASRVATDLSDLSNNIDNVDLWIDGLSETANVMSANTARFQYWFSEAGFTAFRHNFIALHFIAPILPSFGTVYYNGYWLVPLLESAGSAVEAIQQSKWSFDEELPRWQHLLTDYFLPEQKYPAINITSIVGPDGRELSGNVEEVLRMIGAMP